MTDIIHISMENWRGVWRRNQNVAAGFARRFPGRKILYVCLPIDVSNAIRTGGVRGMVRELMRPRLPERSPELPNVFLFRPIKLFPNTLRQGRLANEAIARAQIRGASRAIGLCNPLLYINPHWAAHMPGRLGERAVVYDVGDDWLGLTQSERLRRQIIAEDGQLTRRADAVIVTGQWLLDQKRALRDDVTIIPNGVDVSRYSGVADGSLEAHPMTRDWPRPVIGHSGTLHPDRSSAEWIVAVAHAFPHATVALVGPRHFSEAQEKALAAEPNIRLVGPVDYTEVPGFIRAFDVIFVPHKVGPLSESNSPLKLFESLACGLPIVSTPVAGFRDYPELIRLAGDEAAFIAAIRTALAERSGSLRQRRVTAAGEHTWERRIDAYVRVFEQALQRAAHRGHALSAPTPERETAAAIS